MKFMYIISMFLLVYSILAIKFRQKPKNSVNTTKITIFGDAGSTGTRLIFYQTSNKTFKNICSIKDNTLLLSKIIEKNDTNVFIEGIKSMIMAFKQKNDQYKSKDIRWNVDYKSIPVDFPQIFNIKLYIYGTAGAREAINSFKTFDNGFFLSLAQTINITLQSEVLLHDILIRVISGRMEGICGYVSLYKIINEYNGSWYNLTTQSLKTQNMLYYEIGGASSQIVWPSQVKTVKNPSFLQTNMMISKGYVEFEGFGDGFPQEVYSRSLLGDGAEQCLISSKNQLLQCVNLTQNDLKLCISEAIKQSVVSGGTDQTLAKQNYLDQWTQIMQELDNNFGDFSNPMKIVINSKTVVNLLCKVKNQTDYGFQRGGSCGASIDDCKKKCEFLYDSVQNFTNTVDQLVEPYLQGLIQMAKEAMDEVNNTKYYKDFDNQGVGIMVQLKNIMHEYNWTGSIIFFNYGEWTDGALWLLNHGLSPNDFEQYIAVETDRYENTPRILEGNDGV